MRYKIGTITFHWATNYGAVLQAFALQKYLRLQGCDVEIINYIPRRAWILEKISWLKNLKIRDIKKEKKIEQFRKTELILSTTRYCSNRELKRIRGKYKYVIAGSDQVWNNGFTMRAEGKPTLSYFLNFVGTETKRISYAASFGFDVATDEYIQTVKKEISLFSSISVRENTGLQVLQQLNVEGVVVCDPTLLLEKQIYDELVQKSKRNVEPVFSYILHKNQNIAWTVVDTINNIYGNPICENKNDILSVYDWLHCIKDSKIVVTNSFHAVMFALIFNTTFIAVAVEGSKMNDRIATILDKVSLQERFLNKNDENLIKDLVDKNIDWDNVNCRLADLRIEGQEYLKKAILE